MRPPLLFPVSPALRFPEPARARRVARAVVQMLAFVLGLCAAMQAAHAEDGRALVVAGNVMLERASPGAFSITAVSAGTEIRSGDVVRTGPDGRVQIRFSDGSIVSLQPRTAFRVDQYRFDREGQRAFFYLVRGALRTITGAIGKRNHDDYRMKTPTATVGVRGTEYVAEQTACDPRCSPGVREGLRVAVVQGRIVVTTSAGTIEVAAGESAAAESADAPPHGTQQGPVLPPISHAPPAQRPATSSAASTAAGTGAAQGTAATSTTGAGRTAPKALDRPTLPADPGLDPNGPVPEPVSPGAGDRTSTDAFDTVAPGAGQAASTTSTATSPNGTATSEVSPAPSSANLDLAWTRFAVENATAPGSAISPNEARDPDGELAPVVERFVTPAPSDGAGSPGNGPADGGDPGMAPPQWRAGTHPIGAQGDASTGLSLHVLEPWSLGMPRRVTSGSITLDDSMEMAALEWCRSDASCRLSKGNTSVRDAGHDAYTSWGRWTGGNAHLASSGSPLHIAGSDGMHYLAGVPSATIPTGGVFGYDLIGSTRATLDGGGETGQFSGRAAVAFSPSGARVGLEASVAFPSGGYGFTTPGGVADPARSPLATGPGHTFAGRLPAIATRNHPVDCSAGCAVDVEGGLFGPDAARLGLTYRITGSGVRATTISGVGVFQKKNP